ncbi:MAG: HD domain-containing phosphohydrolase [Pirellulales bacterium]
MPPRYWSRRRTFAACSSACAVPPEKILPSDNPFAARFKTLGPVAYDRDCLNHMADERERHVAHVNEIADACAAGDSSGIATFDAVLHDSLRTAAADVDAYACLGANPFSKPYPTRHSVHTAMVAQMIGAKLGLDETSLQELGLGCLIHDLGMLTVDRMALTARKVLDDREFVDIQKHPFYTLEMLEECVDHIPVGARMVAYQMHERADGSGYPRRRTLEQIHPLARIAGVADAYTALVSERPHRHGMLPYFAMEKLLKDASAGLFDPVAVRGLVLVLGLFPVGSYVEISPQLVGRVIRAGHADYTRPVLEVWKAGNVRSKPAIVDLGQEPKLGVTRPLTTLER